jgi:hypothetical protein
VGGGGEKQSRVTQFFFIVGFRGKVESICIKKAMHLTTNKCAFYHLKYFWSTFLREFTCVRTGICVIPVAGSKKCAKWNWKGGGGLSWPLAVPDGEKGTDSGRIFPACISDPGEHCKQGV